MSSPSEKIEIHQDEFGGIEFEPESDEEFSIEKIKRRHDYDKDSHAGKLIDRSLLMHYVFKRTLNGNHLAPLKKDIKKCFELGYSSGILMMEMASEFKSCNFYGIDNRPLSPKDTYPDNCHFEMGNFYEKIPYPDEYFDFVYLRLTMVHVKKSHYDFVMKEMHRILKKGGWIEFMESDQTFLQKGPIYKKLEQEVFEGLQCRDIDPLKIHEIKDILPKMGFHNVKVNTFDISLGGYGGEIGENMQDVWKMWINLNKDFKRDHMTSEEFNKYVETICSEFEEYKTFHTVYNIVGQKKD
ncbi:hypothetical protein Glove_99g152 [Diversispora epigaea]|uniref:Methyltransferase type 11 domain-containing protein n=1 Tax=Diversispora epigaea TaxID=1348612 RepID=A0A397J447_9GLOM|nr:hypothetical protein Glove_99g152 [Diversispora epigaea]